MDLHMNSNTNNGGNRNRNPSNDSNYTYQYTYPNLSSTSGTSTTGTSTTTTNTTTGTGTSTLRLKCIVLGSAGAGKTSFLRRYFTGKYDMFGQRKSTLGADYYSAIIRNPCLEDGCGRNRGRNRDHHCVEHTNNDTAGSIEGACYCCENENDNDNGSVKKKMKKKQQKEKKKKKKNTTATASTITNDATNVKIHGNSRSINEHQSKSNQMNMNAHTKMNKIRQSEQVSIQIWDTAGNERSRTKYDDSNDHNNDNGNDNNNSLTSRFGDSFFQHANAAILIYDATSSTSFLQLIQWYSELLHRLQLIHMTHDCDSETNTNVHTASEQTTETNNTHHAKGTHKTTHHHHHNHQQQQKQHTSKNNHESISSRYKFPVLVVATKLDVVHKVEQARNKAFTPYHQHRRRRRDILGLKGKTFKGQDYHYEYTVYPNKHHQQQQQQSASSTSTSTSTPTTSTMKFNTTTKNNKNGNDNQPLSYGLEGGKAWTTDEEYQQYLRIAEDECFPDNKMVMLWCKRNGLEHVECSALNGMNVNVAIDTMVRITLEARMEEILQKHCQSLKKPNHADDNDDHDKNDDHDDNDHDDDIRNDKQTVDHHSHNNNNENENDDCIKGSSILDNYYEMYKDKNNNNYDDHQCCNLFQCIFPSRYNNKHHRKS